MRKHPALTAVLFMALGACAPAPEEEACTLVGCEDRVVVTFSEAVDVPYRAEIALDEGETFTVDCTPNGLDANGADIFASCDPAGIYFDGVAPERLSVRLEQDGEVLTETEVSPSYEAVRPNGEGCPPVCQHGGAELTL